MIYNFYSFYRILCFCSRLERGLLFLLHHTLNNRFSKTQPCGQCSSQNIQQRADEQGYEEDDGGEEHFALYYRYTAIKSPIGKREKDVEHPATTNIESNPCQTKAEETTNECECQVLRNNLSEQRAAFGTKGLADGHLGQTALHTACHHSARFRAGTKRSMKMAMMM